MKLRYALPGAYSALALLTWIDFWSSQPDGLANVGLMLVVLPVTLLDLALRPATAPGSFVLMPDQFGYYGDHAVFFGISALIMALLLWLLGSWIDGRSGRSQSEEEH